jgi:hypothetical protein
VCSHVSALTGAGRAVVAKGTGAGHIIRYNPTLTTPSPRETVLRWLRDRGVSVKFGRLRAAAICGALGIFAALLSCRRGEPGGLAMKTKLLGVTTALALLGSFAQSAGAATILSGSVTEDPVTHLFTYNYSIDNTNGSIPIWEISILISTQNLQFFPPLAPPFAPVAFTTPSGWEFHPEVFGGTSGIFGTFWQFYHNPTGIGCPGCIQVGDSLSGFSVTSYYAPLGSTLDNYFLDAGEFPPDLRGNTVAPGPLTPGITPLPAALPLFVTGLGALGLLGWRRKRKAQAAA